MVTTPVTTASVFLVWFPARACAYIRKSLGTRLLSSLSLGETAKSGEMGETVMTGGAAVTGQDSSDSGVTGEVVVMRETGEVVVYKWRL